jgi:hypothetical protein
MNRRAWWADPTLFFCGFVVGMAFQVHMARERGKDYHHRLIYYPPVQASGICGGPLAVTEKVRLDLIYSAEHKCWEVVKQ